MLATFAEDAVLASGEEVVVGARALRVVFDDAFAAPVDAELTLRSAVVQDDVAACELSERLTVAGQYHDVDVAAFYTVRRGLLQRVRVYRDLSSSGPGR